MDRDPVKIAQQPLGQQPVIGPAGFDRVAPHHQPRIIRVGFPGAIRIFHAHAQDAPIAVNILLKQPLHRFFVVRIGPGAGTDDPGLVRQRPFGSIGVDARDDVKSARIESLGDTGFLPVTGDELVNEIQHRCRTCHFAGMQVAIHPQGRLLVVRTGGKIGCRYQPDLPSFVAFSNTFQPQQVGVFFHKGL